MSTPSSKRPRLIRRSCRLALSEATTDVGRSSLHPRYSWTAICRGDVTGPWVFGARRPESVSGLVDGGEREAGGRQRAADPSDEPPRCCFSQKCPNPDNPRHISIRYERHVFPAFRGKRHGRVILRGEPSGLRPGPNEGLRCRSTRLKPGKNCAMAGVGGPRYAGAML